MLAHQFQIILNFLYVCQSVICLTYLLILYKYRDNSSSGGDIFLKFLGDIIGTLLHKCQIFLIFLYVCQSVSWLTSLVKLDKYRDISSSVWNIFLKFFWGISGMFLHLVQITLKILFVCHSVILLTYLLKFHKFR